jgi:hypothetical protein
MRRDGRFTLALLRLMSVTFAGGLTEAAIVPLACFLA